MTHRIVVNVETGVTSIVEYTAEEQAIHDAAVAAQQAEAEAKALADAQALAEAQAAQQTTTQSTTP
jgi:regulator of protease activity HflC (stomatin/prohibitin superfamily)